MRINLRSDGWIPQLRLAVDTLSGRIEHSADALARQVDWSSPYRNDCPTILCLDRALFRKDLAEMRKRVAFNFVTVSAAAVKRHQEPWVPEALRTQTFFAHYLDTVLAHAKARLTEFAVKFLTSARYPRKIDAVLAGNTDYWQEEALKLACRQLDIPFVALCRENYVWEHDVEIVSKRFRDSQFAFAGTAVAVASEATRRAMVQSGSFDPATVFITGSPRFDPWVDRLGLPAGVNHDTVTLLSYADPLYLAPDCFKETLGVFVDAALAARASGLRFLVKVKKPNEVMDVVTLDSRIENSGILVTDAEPLPELFGRSRIIIGYNSLSVLEALLSEVRVAVPWWDDATRNTAECLMHASNADDAEVAEFPTNAGALRALIDQAIAAPLAAKAPRATLFQRFSKQCRLDADRTSSAAVAEVIDWAIRRVAGSARPEPVASTQHQYSRS